MYRRRKSAVARQRLVTGLAGLLTLLCNVLALTLASASAATASLHGVWSLQIAERNMFVLRLECGSSCTGQLERPRGLKIEYSLFEVSDTSPRIDRVESSVRHSGGWRLTLVSQAGERRDFVVQPKGDAVILSLADEPEQGGLGPWRLEKRTMAELSADWEPNRAYVVGDRDAPDPEMAKLFSEDQAERMHASGVSGLELRDRARRAQTRALLESGRLVTGLDLERAAFVFQHGDNGNDFLLAHALAMAASAKGRPGAVWLAAASLDRYLRSRGEQQIFGTQFVPGENGMLRGAPCDGNVVPDALRPQLGLPPGAGSICRPDIPAATQAQRAER